MSCHNTRMTTSSHTIALLEEHLLSDTRLARAAILSPCLDRRWSPKGSDGPESELPMYDDGDQYGCAKSHQCNFTHDNLSHRSPPRDRRLPPLLMTLTAPGHAFQKVSQRFKMIAESLTTQTIIDHHNYYFTTLPPVVLYNPIPLIPSRTRSLLNSQPLHEHNSSSSTIQRWPRRELSFSSSPIWREAGKFDVDTSKHYKASWRQYAPGCNNGTVARKNEFGDCSLSYIFVCGVCELEPDHFFAKWPVSGVIFGSNAVVFVFSS